MHKKSLPCLCEMTKFRLLENIFRKSVTVVTWTATLLVKGPETRQCRQLDRWQHCSEIFRLWRNVKSCWRKVKSALCAGEIFRFQRKVKEKIRRGADFSHFNYISHLISFWCRIFRAGADCLPQPLPQADGASLRARTCYFSVLNSVFWCLRHVICLRHDIFHTICLLRRRDMFRYAER